MELTYILRKEKETPISKERIYEPSRKELKKMYGRIDLYSAEKTFASGVCCMCCH